MTMGQPIDTTVSALHPDVVSLVDAVEIRSPTQYVLRGEVRDVPAVQVLPPGMAWPAASGEGTSALTQALELELYGRCYVQPSGAPASTDPMAQRDFGVTLSAANTGRGTWESGWRVHGVDEDGLVGVLKDGLTFWVPPTGLRTLSGTFRPGDWCRVWVTKELRNLMPGFYFAIGNGDEHDRRDAPEPQVRLYWHLTQEAAAPYLATVTSRLNALNVPFRTKVLTDPGAYVRADAGVLYLERRLYPRLREVLLEVHAAVAPRLRPGVPLFTRELAPGLGLAEDPGNGLSFGQSRCRLVASGLWLGFTRGRTSREERLASVAEAFRKAGVDPARPYLETGTPELYAARAEVSGTAAAPAMGADVAAAATQATVSATGVAEAAVARAAETAPATATTAARVGAQPAEAPPMAVVAPPAVPELAAPALTATSRFTRMTRRTRAQARKGRRA